MKDLQLPDDMIERVTRRAKRAVEKLYAPKQGLNHFRIQAFPFSNKVTIGGYSREKQARFDAEATQNLTEFCTRGPKTPFRAPTPSPYRDQAQRNALPGGVNFQNFHRKHKEHTNKMNRPMSTGWTNPAEGWLGSVSGGQRSLPLVHHATRRGEILW
jgi:ribonuclease BN (tRNA processing enzyme)